MKKVFLVIGLVTFMFMSSCTTTVEPNVESQIDSVITLVDTTVLPVCDTTKCDTICIKK